MTLADGLFDRIPAGTAVSDSFVVPLWAGERERKKVKGELVSSKHSGAMERNWHWRKKNILAFALLRNLRAYVGILRDGERVLLAW